MECFLGIDIGSSATKVGLFGRGGEILAVATYSYVTVSRRPGFKEQDPNDWWSAVCDGTHRVLSFVPGASVLAVGITSYIASLTFVDAKGLPLRPSIGFQDQRAVEEVRELYESFSRAELAKLLAIDLPPAPTWPLPRLLWMRKHEPALLDRTQYLLQAKDFVNLQLTERIASDPSSNRGLVDLAANCAALKVLERLSLPDLLPPLFPPEHVIGGITSKAALATGLQQGVPVVVGWNDLNACVLGSGIIESGQAFDLTGTSEHIGIVTTDACSCSELISAPYLPGKRLFYGVTTSGGGALEWFRRFSGKPFDELLTEAASARARLIFLPHLEGERSPIWDPHASGVLIGLRTVHGQGDVVRAILEGVAFSLRQNLTLIERYSHLKPQTLVTSGGASTSQLWNQIKAQILCKNIVTLKNPHSGVQGAAILAAVAAGVYPNLTSAATAMVQTERYYYPSKEGRDRADRMYGIYKDVYPVLRDTLARLDAEALSQVDEENDMTSENRAVIFGAGKIARGFIAHLLKLSGYRITFVEKYPQLVDALRDRGEYLIEIMNAPNKSVVIRDFQVLQSGQINDIANAVAEASVVFISIGGPNLPQVAPLLAAGIARRTNKLNIILGENYFQPAMWLRKLIAEHLSSAQNKWFESNVGIVETMILRSVIEPTASMKEKDPLSLKAQDMWEIPADKEAFIGDVPPICGLLPKEHFQGSLVRKLFTYNCINAMIAYSGYLKGYQLLSEAANDIEIVELARRAYEESSAALCQRYGFDPDEQRQFAESAIAKYQSKEIVDPIERNARDPLRKLSRNDRLVGPACLAIDNGVLPIALSRGIAAALLYDHPNDPSSVSLQNQLRGKGLQVVLDQVCGIEGNSTLKGLICMNYEKLKSKIRAASTASGQEMQHSG